MSEELSRSNPYAKSRIVVFNDGSEELEASEFARPSNPRFVTHLVKEGDELTALAYQYYSTQVQDASKYWHVIARDNDIENPIDLSDLIGQRIRIPDIGQYLTQ